MPTVLITGCDSGIGREFAQQYDAEGWDVIASYRDISNALPSGKRLRNIALDLTRDDDFAALPAALDGAPVDLLVSNAGVGLDIKRLGALDFNYVRTMYEINAIGPLRLIETLVDNLAASDMRRIASITSRMGCIGLNLSGGHYGYRASKAGINAMMRSLAIDLFPRGITVVSIHPGWVDTAGGGGNAAVPVGESVSSMRKLIHHLGNHETGQIFSYDGTPLPW
uniref:SDR family oxidoreductase n=1 Tax=Pararhizobium sp. IMCC3301 TaxID=3067904 RepID=UPI0027420F97|nr:SDR family oxidoreductase [Pararhizobium sp. IMCC3301]